MFTEQGQCLQNEDNVYRTRTMFTEQGQFLQNKGNVYRMRTMFTERGQCLQNIWTMFTEQGQCLQNKDNVYRTRTMLFNIFILILTQASCLIVKEPLTPKLFIVLNSLEFFKQFTVKIIQFGWTLNLQDHFEVRPLCPTISLQYRTFNSKCPATGLQWSTTASLWIPGTAAATTSSIWLPKSTWIPIKPSSHYNSDYTGTVHVNTYACCHLII